MTNAIVTHTSGGGIATLGAGKSVLGETAARIPIGGKIRPGIKILKSEAAANPKAKALYEAGVAAKKTFTAIALEIKEQCGIDWPLVPKNVPYFTVHPQDFVRPETAKEIMEKYATDGEYGHQLYRFPIIFPLDGWQAVMPHALRTYTRSELVYWSDYAPDGKRYCMTHAPVLVDQKSKRAQRVYGGRPAVLRAENEGICDPMKCREYQSRECNLSGEIIFYIPDISGSTAISLPTNSFYSMNEWKKKLELVAFLTGGKISGLFDGKPMFSLSKKQQEISMIDPKDGKAKKVKQWLIVLEEEIDMTRVFQRVEQRAMLAAGARAAGALSAPPTIEPHDDDEEPPETVTTITDVPAEPVAQTDAAAELIQKIKDMRAVVLTGLEALEIPIEHFSAYGMAHWGQDWSRTLDGLNKANELLRVADKDKQVLQTIRDWK